MSKCGGHNLNEEKLTRDEPKTTEADVVLLSSNWNCRIANALYLNETKEVCATYIFETQYRFY